MEKANEVQLEGYIVELRERLTWGQQEQIRMAVYGGLKVGGKAEVQFDATAIMAAKYKAIEVCVKKITADGVEIPYTKEWLDNLSVEDGDKLYAAVNEVSSGAKKK